MEEENIQLLKIQDRLIKLLEALSRLETNDDWKTLKELVFDKSISSIERQLLNETLNKEVNLNQIYKLQGEWAWAKQYTDVNRFIETLRKQLEDVKSKLK
jgi:hypothetical protein